MDLSISLIVLLLSMSTILATKGWDVSQYTSLSAMQCMKKGMNFGIVRGYCSYGAVDKNACGTLKNAKSAGFQYVDIYMFPCVSNCGKGAATQVHEMVSGLSGCPYNMIWLDVERYKWHSSKSENRKWAEDAVSAMRGEGKKVGIYSSYYSWEEIMGLEYSGLSSYPLWYLYYIYIYIYNYRYPHYDGNPSFSDFKSFGGWSSPAIKQYKGTTSYCGASIDENYY